MANTVRIKRSTSTDTPTSLQNAELAYSESSDKLYIGVGTGGVGGSATTITPIGGAGHFLTKTLAGTTYQTQSGMSSYLTTSTASTTYAPLASPTFTGTPTLPTGTIATTQTAGNSTTAVATTAFVTTADNLKANIASPTFTGTPLSTTAAVDTNTTQIATTAYVVGQSYLKSATASTTYAPLASPTFTGTVTIPSGASISGFAPLSSPALTGTPTSTTATAGTNTTQIATTAFVSTAVSNLVASAPEALNTLNELALALGSDASFSTTVATSLGGKLATASNLSELTATASTARTNLGLGTISTQASSNVSITGGTIDGVTFDGGSF